MNTYDLYMQLISAVPMMPSRTILQVGALCVRVRAVC